jgi:hypothetical protein
MRGPAPTSAKERRQTRASRQRVYVAALLVALGFIIFAERWHTADEAFERDIGSHAVIAHEMLAGRSLYSDLWDSKPPAVWLSYAAAELICGYGPSEVLFLGVVAALLTMLGVYRAVEAVAEPPAALVAAAIWVVTCGDLSLWANQPNSEVFINAALAWALALWLRAPEDTTGTARFVAIGVLSFVASLYKTVVPAIVATLCIAHVLVTPRGHARRRAALVQVLLVVLVNACCWVLVLGYFAWTRRGSLFAGMLFQTGFAYTKSRGGMLLTNIVAGFGPRGLANSALSGIWPIAVLSLLIAAVGLATGPRRVWGLVVAYAVGAQIAIGLPGRLYPHYYQLLLPVFAVAAGLAYGTVFEKTKGALRSGFKVAAVVSLLALVTIQAQNYALPAERWSVAKYGPQFVLARKVGEHLATHLKANEQIYVWGPDPEIYFWSRTRPPTGVVWAWDTVEGPLAAMLARRTLEDLKRQLPQVVVVSNWWMNRLRGNSHPILNWMETRYVAMPTNSRSSPFVIYAIPDQELQSRLRDYVAQRKDRPQMRPEAHATTLQRSPAGSR